VGTESLRAIVDVARSAQFQRLYAYCHYQHRNSAHVMEKCGFENEGLMRNYIEFPNLAPGSACDVTLYAWTP
jgi:RimJ/RimL family protein N-acetyltransferase